MRLLRTALLASAVALTATIGSYGIAGAQDAVLSKSWDDIVAQAKSEGSLTFYAWWGEQFWRDAAASFEHQYGIKVNVVIGDGSATVGKVLAELPNQTGTVDAMLAGGVEVKSLLDAKAFEGPIASIIPGTDKLDAKLSKMQEGFATNGYLVPVYRNQVGILYDPDKVPTPPQSWGEFTAWVTANPKQFAFNDPSKGGAGQAFVQTALANIVGDEAGYQGATEADPAKVAAWSAAWAWFNSNEDNFTITASNSDSVDRVNQGEASMATAWDDDTAIAMAKGTLFKRAKFYIPAFGLPGGGDSLGIPANAAHKAAALLFISYLITPEMQKHLNETIGSYPARTDVSVQTQIVPEEERQANARAWFPSVYKQVYIQQFVSEVLQK